MNKLTVVTEPNIYVMDQPSFLVIAKDEDINSFYTGFFIDKPKTFYYNSTNDYTSINIQTIEDPIRFLVDWTVKQKDN